MIAKTHYERYILVLAAVGFLSCQRAPEAANGGGAGAPADASKASSRAEVDLAAGTVLWVQLQKDLDSSKLKIGDHFGGQIEEDVIRNGRPAIPKGTGVKGRVTNVETAHQKGSAGLLTLVLDSMTLNGSTYNISTNPVTLQAPPLQQNLPEDKANRAVTAAENAYIPKNGTLQFFLSQPVKLKA